MSERKPLLPHEIRVIKLDRMAILELLQEILGEIDYEKFRLPRHIYQKKVLIDWMFDENQCEIILVAHRHNYKVDMKTVTEYIQRFSVNAIDSLLSKPKGKVYDYSIRNGTPILDCRTDNVFGMLLDKLGIHIRPLGNRELRVIRLSQQAIHELLWEHFMRTADEAMDLPEEEIDDIQTIYHMYTKGSLEALTLYVMNFGEASDEAFLKNQQYCDQNVSFTTDSYLKMPAKGRKYVSVIVPQ